MTNDAKPFRRDPGAADARRCAAALALVEASIGQFQDGKDGKGKAMLRQAASLILRTREPDLECLRAIGMFTAACNRGGWQGMLLGVCIVRLKDRARSAPDAAERNLASNTRAVHGMLCQTGVMFAPPA